MNVQEKIRFTFSGFIFLCLAKVSFTQDSIINYSFYTLAEAFYALDFNPMMKGNSFFPVTADVHSGAKGTDRMLARIKEVNKKCPYPAFLGIYADMIVSGTANLWGESERPGYWSYWVRETEDFRQAENAYFNFIPSEPVHVGEYALLQ